MRSRFALTLVVAFALAVGGPLLSAQSSAPAGKKLAVAGLAPVFEGWYDHRDGTHALVVGYNNKDAGEIDIPIGPDNHFEPGALDRGQPTHFLPSRRHGMFTVALPRDTMPSEKLWWVLTVNGVTQRMPMQMTPEHRLTSQYGSEERPGVPFNQPPVLSFLEKDQAFQGMTATVLPVVQRWANVGVPMPLGIWVHDDALFASGSVPADAELPPLVSLTVSKFRGPGVVTIGRGHEHFTVISGGRPGEDYVARTTTMLMFSDPGEYLIHITANDFSGGNGITTGAYWTTAMLKVVVKPAWTPTLSGH